MTRCWYCGVSTQAPPRPGGEPSPGTIHPPTMRTREHLRPKSRGGRGGGNLVWSCLRCNKFVGDWSITLKRRFRAVMREAGGWSEILSLVGDDAALRRLIVHRPPWRLPKAVAVAAGIRDPRE